jgi:thiol:disulfide interchange protein
MLKKWLILLLFCSSCALFADEPSLSSSSSPLLAELYSDHQAVSPGEEFSLILDIKLEPDWHFYWKNPGEAGMAPSLDWELPEGISIVRTEWPTPERFEKEGMVTFGYSSQVPFLIIAKADSSVPLKEIEIKGNMQWVICSSETCLPGSTEVRAKIHVASSAKMDQERQSRFEAVKKALPQTLPLSCLTRDKDAITVSLGDEVALADASPQFFPETGSNFHIIPQVKGADIKLSSDAGKGILVVGDKAYHVGEVEESSPDENLLTFFGALFFAFIGGLILNLMPCVLPVVSLKVMSFVKMAGQSRGELIKHGVFFTLGVLISFWALAGAIILLQSTGEAVGWGFQLQDPLFIALLTLLFVLMALSLFGVFELGTGIAAMAGEASIQSEKKGYQSSFFSGIFATAVATPCTGPFMGSALGYALTQPSYITMAIFTALALGMSLPYLLLGIFPALIRWFPKPGAWMESFKQFLGFLMMLTALWLLWVFVGQTSETALFGLLFALLIASLGAWIFGRFGAAYRSKTTRIAGYVLAACCLVFALGTVNFSSRLGADETSSEAPASDWEPYSEARVLALRAQGTPVLIDFTAKWCLICQTNHMVLTQGKVEKTLKERGVVRMKADWTRRDPEITKALKGFGRSGVPLYVLYGEEKEPQILPQVLVPDSVIGLVESKTKVLEEDVR